MSTNFGANSRYQNVDVATLTAADGTTITYLKMRVVPSPEAFATLQEYEIRQRDRLDNLAAQFLGDPELFWRLCDANGAIRPDELTDTPGRRIRITLPQGIPGAGAEGDMGVGNG
jgi:hypothetical protein